VLLPIHKAASRSVHAERHEDVSARKYSLKVNNMPCEIDTEMYEL